MLLNFVKIVEVVKLSSNNLSRLNRNQQNLLFPASKHLNILDLHFFPECRIIYFWGNLINAF